MVKGASNDTIKVFLRLRPDRGKAAAATIPYSVEHDFERSRINFHVDRTKLSDGGVNNSTEDYSFTFSRVFEPNATQEQVFDGVCRECCQNVLDGYNSTVCAYGQTGSGKTFSITGGTDSRAQRGLIPRALSMLYDEMAKRKEYQFTVGISYMQIYNDRGSDLLNRGEDAKSIEDLPVVTVHETDDDVILKGLECHTSASVEEALNLLFLGDTNRLYCETPMNKYSSRSHCIFTVSIEARQHGSALVRRSKLNLVDLAGSERVGRTGVSGSILSEAKYINLSLHFLEHVIVALSEQSQGRRDHVPYRNSMMTMVLRDSLGGNCKTVMLATAHPGLDQLWETMSTCRFATRVASIKTLAFVNEETDPVLLVRQLRREVAQLKDQVALLGGGKDVDPNRALSLDETERCRELVRRFVADPDAGLVGAGSDMARIQACFRILRDMAAGGGSANANANSNATPRTPAQTPASTTAAATFASASASADATTRAAAMSSEQEALLRDEVRRLRTSLQMKENEMTLLFDLVQRHNGPRHSIAIQAGGDDSSSNVRDAAAVFGGGAGAGAMSSSLSSRPLSSPGTVASFGDASAMQAPRDPNFYGDSSRRGSIVGRSGDGDGATPPAAAAAAASAGDYNLSALADPELLRDRTTAFEAFRRSYRKHEQVNKCHAELQERIGVAKAAAADINGLIERMKASRSRIQQLRAERALLPADPSDGAGGGGGGADGGGGGAVSGEEANLLQELQDVLRPQWTQRTDALKAEKEAIQHLQLLIKRAQEQLIKDFDAWYGARQTQIAVAAARAPGSNAAAAATTTAGVTASALSTSSSSRPAQPQPPNQPPQQTPQQQRAGAGAAVPTTGNPAVDAELARMYEAREALRARLAANMGGQQ